MSRNKERRKVQGLRYRVQAKKLMSKGKGKGKGLRGNKLGGWEVRMLGGLRAEGKD